MDVIGYLVGWVVALVFVARYLRRREAKRQEAEQLPPQLAVVTFRDRLSDEELRKLGERLAQERALGTAFRGPSWTPTPQARA